MSFWKSQTLTEQAIAAADRIEEDIELLRADRECALCDFRRVAERLGEINSQLDEKSALCGSLIAQLGRTRDTISRQVSDNEKVREKILGIIGE